MMASSRKRERSLSSAIDQYRYGFLQALRAQYVEPLKNKESVEHILNRGRITIGLRRWKDNIIMQKQKAQNENELKDKNEKRISLKRLQTKSKQVGTLQNLSETFKNELELYLLRIS